VEKGKVMLNHHVEKWEEKLNRLLRRTDLMLEESYGQLFARHPARPAHGCTANPQHDGLFRVTASFSPGFGSELGKGYVLQFELVSLEKLPNMQLDAIQQQAVRFIQKGLDEALPGKNLSVKRDGTLWKIVGDLSLAP